MSPLFAFLIGWLVSIFVTPQHLWGIAKGVGGKAP